MMTKTTANRSRPPGSLVTTLDQQQLVIEGMEQLKSAFNYYDSHISLFDETNGDLVMTGGAGKAGQSMLARGHSLSKGKGLTRRGLGKQA